MRLGTVQQKTTEPATKDQPSHEDRYRSLAMANIVSVIKKSLVDGKIYNVRQAVEAYDVSSKLLNKVK